MNVVNVVNVVNLFRWPEMCRYFPSPVSYALSYALSYGVSCGDADAGGAGTPFPNGSSRPSAPARTGYTAASSRRRNPDRRRQRHPGLHAPPEGLLAGAGRRPHHAAFGFQGCGLVCFDRIKARR